MSAPPSQPSAHTNELELRVVGMSRSGNHAIVQWIVEQAAGRVCLLNCVEPRTNPFVTARPMHDDRRAWASYGDFRLRREASGRLSPKDLLIYSYEDCFLTSVCHQDFETRHDEYVGRSRRRLDVLILRDPFNLFASRWRSRYSGVTLNTVSRIWVQHARQFLGERQYVTQSFLPISYNQWASDKRYRRGLARQIGLDFTDAGFNKVPATGGGSSFDQLRLDGEAQKMDVFGRWRLAQHEEEYLTLFNREVLRLSDAIFGTVDHATDFQRFAERLAHATR